MEQMSTWEMVLLGILVVVVLLWFGPGAKTMLEQSRQAENRDWMGVIIPIVLVILFVFLLISMV
jgi:hypothetical protein